MNTTGIVGWAPEPQTRGTMGLVWSCLATIFLCTWNAVHPNLPGLDDSAWIVLRRRVKYLLIALVAPEGVCMLALVEFRNARILQKEAPGWSLVQCFYLTMGGFVVEVDDQTIRLPPKSLLALLQSNVLSWPDVTEQDILDRSKADWFLKSLALVQIIWFITQVIGRAAQGLSVTTLELFTLGVISCALFMYMAWWKKPFDVRMPFVIRSEKALPEGLEPQARMSYLDDGLDSQKDEKTMFLLLACLCTVFGAIHLLGWQFHFPTSVESWLWRASSIACAALPLAILAGYFWELWDSKYGEGIVFAIGGLYVLCRLYMLVEMFVSLRAVPADVYKTPQWSQYFPSFG